MTEEIRELDAQREMETPEESDETDRDLDVESREPSVPISELRKVRAEAAKYRKQLRHLESNMEKDRKAVEFAKMEETERLKAIAKEAEEKARSIQKRANIIARRSAIINAASALGFHNPQDAASIINLEQIEADEDGNLNEEQITEVVRSLAESKSYLIRSQHDNQDMADFGPTNPAPNNWPKPRFRTKDQIDRLKQQSDEAMKSGRVAAAIRLYNQAWEMERGIKKK